MTLTFRDIDLMQMEAEAIVAQMMQEFHNQMLGKRGGQYGQLLESIPTEFDGGEPEFEGGFEEFADNADARPQTAPTPGPRPLPAGNAGR